MNLALPIASQQEAQAGVAADKLMTPERTAQAIAALAPSGGGTAGRTRLTVDASFDVPSASWPSIVSVHNYARDHLDLAGFRIICRLVSDYSGWDVIEGHLVGAKGPQSFLIRGSADNQARIFSGGVYAQNGAQCRLQFMQLQPSNGTSVVVTDGVVEFGDVYINTFGDGPMFNVAGSRAKARAVGHCTIVGMGNCRHVFIAESGASIELPHPMSIAGAPTWTQAFCQADLGGIVDATGFSYSGGYPTGSRYTSSSMGIVFTGLPPGHPAAPTFFPGSSAGSSTGGYYQ